MDAVLIVQVVINIIFSSAAKKNTPGGGLILLLLTSWLAPIFILGFFRAILVWVISMFATAMILMVQEKFS